MTHPRHAESNAAYSLALLKQSSGCQVAQFNKASDQAKADVVEFSVASDHEASVKAFPDELKT